MAPKKQGWLDAGSCFDLPAGKKAPPVAGPLGSLVSDLAGPDELKAILALDLSERCVDRGRKARIVELDREVVATLLGCLLPGSSEFDILRCTAKR